MRGGLFAILLFFDREPVLARVCVVTVKAKKAVAAPLLMPTTITAQNGAVMHQDTKIAVTGCAAVKAKAKKKSAAKGRRH